MVEKVASYSNSIPFSKKRVGGLSNLEMGLIIGLRLLLCPGDEIAAVIAQASNTLNANMPDVALLYKEPEIVTVFPEPTFLVSKVAVAVPVTENV